MNIKINNLSFKYDKKAAKLVLNAVNLNIIDGTINVLLGLNGSGKTTLLKLLAGLEKPLEGSIYYDEEELAKTKIKRRSEIFAYVPQHSNITGDIPVKDYLIFGATNTMAFYQAPGEKQISKVMEVANRLDITKLLDKKIGEISGGERQIVLIASALVQNAPVLLLDEPTSALDIKNQHLVLDVLKQIVNEGKTIILSSHNPNHALFLNSNVVLIHEGQIKDQGPSKEIIEINRLKEVYGDSVCYSKDQEYEEISFR